MCEANLEPPAPNIGYCCQARPAGTRAGGNMRNQFLRAVCAFAMASAAVLSATSAQAKYTAIDQIPLLDDSGQPVLDDDGYPVFRPIQIQFEGYCDTQSSIGEQCDETYTLPYSVIFGDEETNQVLLRDDGSLDFVFGPPSELGDAPSDEELTHRFQVLASFDTGINAGGGTPQVGTFQLQGSSLLATWFTCPTPGINCRINQHTALLTPGKGGFDIRFTDLSGGVNTAFLAAGFNPAQVSPAPEPSSWAMMILGFGAAGAFLRSHRRRGALAQVVS